MPEFDLKQDWPVLAVAAAGIGGLVWYSRSARTVTTYQAFAPQAQAADTQSQTQLALARMQTQAALLGGLLGLLGKREELQASKEIAMAQIAGSQAIAAMQAQAQIAAAQLQAQAAQSALQAGIQIAQIQANAQIEAAKVQADVQKAAIEAELQAKQAQAQAQQQAAAAQAQAQTTSSILGFLGAIIGGILLSMPATMSTAARRRILSKGILAQLEATKFLQGVDISYESIEDVKAFLEQRLRKQMEQRGGIPGFPGERPRPWWSFPVKPFGPKDQAVPGTQASAAATGASAGATSGVSVTAPKTKPPKFVAWKEAMVSL
jgi:hypothetical protein